MPKGYVIGQIDVTDPEAYKEYAAKVPATIAQFGGRYLVRGGKSECKEGSWLPRSVTLEFDSYEQALAWYESDVYQAIVGIRQAASRGNLVIVEGHE